MGSPHVHAITLELLQPWLSNTDELFLDVGSGSGFMCAAMALLAGSQSRVHARCTVIGNFAVEAALHREHIPELVEHSKLNIADAGHADLLSSGG